MDTRRLILVMIFTFSSFLLWENWQKYNQPKPAAEVAAAGHRLPPHRGARRVRRSACRPAASRRLRRLPLRR
jgi:hypothetical protein